MVNSMKAQVRTLANQQRQLMATRCRSLRMHSKLYGLLTAEQRVKADQMMKRACGPHHGPGPGPPITPGSNNDPVVKLLG